MRASGASLRQIAKFLDANGYPTKRRLGKWSAQAVSDVLGQTHPPTKES
jgi:hypothetical protein